MLHAVPRQLSSYTGQALPNKRSCHSKLSSVLTIRIAFAPGSRLNALGPEPVHSLFIDKGGDRNWKHHLADRPTILTTALCGAEYLAAFELGVESFGRSRGPVG